MANPKCGTCRYFQENDLPGSGWCHHPQRKVSSDVKILVRRSELACRDDWSNSLWQPATGESDEQPTARGRHTGAVAPASLQSLHAVLSKDAALTPASGEDVLLSEGRIVSENHDVWKPVARPFPAGHFDPRTAIFRAREAYREKVRANAAATRAPGVEATAPTGPEIEGNVHHAEEQVSAKIDSPAVTNDAPVRTLADSREWTDDVTGTPDPTVSTPTRQPASQTGRTTDVSKVSTGEKETLGSPTERESTVVVTSDERTEIISSVAPVPPRDLVAAADASLGLPPADLPGWFRSDLPRVCRACRDFRPGADGQRGWCGNAWAFTHRHLVQEDDVAPCHSAIGDWWVAVDDVWLVAADVASHSRATPLLDRMISEESAQRRRS